MEKIIKNEKITLVVNTYASEMHSLKLNGQDYEYLWQGDPKYWKGRNPILFPQVSSTPSKINIIKNKEYPMGNHGFARNSEFEFINENKDSLSLLLKDNDETLKQYPYHFNLLVNYTLKNSSVCITYEITNLNDEIMPFGFGLHPAFNTEKDFKETKIVFDDDKELIINKDLFAKYPTYFEEPTPKKAILNTNSHHIQIDFDEFNILAVWSPVGPFVCIEPWISAPASDINFESRKDNINLKKHATYKVSYKITILD